MWFAELTSAGPSQEVFAFAVRQEQQSNGCPTRATDDQELSLDQKDVLDAILYMATTGCQWRMLEPDNRWVLTYMKGLSVNAKISIIEMKMTF